MRQHRPGSPSSCGTRVTDAELVLLGLLAEQPRHGYQLEAVVAERGVREWTALGFSSIYYLLNKLEPHGLVTSERPDTQAKRSQHLLTHLNRPRRVRGEHSRGLGTGHCAQRAGADGDGQQSPACTGSGGLGAGAPARTRSAAPGVGPLSRRAGTKSPSRRSSPQSSSTASRCCRPTWSGSRIRCRS